MKSVKNTSLLFISSQLKREPNEKGGVNNGAK